MKRTFTIFGAAIKKPALLILCQLAAIAATCQPTITAVSPLVGYPASAVTITGTGFNATAADNIVYFGATKATVSSATATSLTVTVPVGATYMRVSVDNTATHLTAYSDHPFLPDYNNSTYIPGLINFNANIDFAAGSSPYSVAIGDIDGDGKPDIVVANQESYTISVYHNTSTSGAITTGSFAAAVSFATGSSPMNIAIGDIDGDGKPDLVVANNGSNTISVYHNTSTSGAITTASFAAPVVFATGATPFSIAIGDIDGDGKPDLAVANQGSNTVSVLRNTSTSGSITTASFAAQVTFATGTTPYSVAIGDIDGDGKPDLAVANEGSSTVSVFRNTSTSGSITAASFAAQVAFATGIYPYSVAIGDIDGDGKPDLAVANGGSATVSVLHNTSTSGSITTGSFAAAVGFATGTDPTSVAIGDIDGDGKPDLVVANLESNTVSVLRNTSASGSITTASFAAQVPIGTETVGVSAGPWSVAIGDIDGDGKPDLVIANSSSNKVSVIRNNPLVSPPASPTITSVSPLAGYPASSVTITGTDFNTTAANDVVYFGATRAVVSSASATSLIVAVPVGATYTRVSVDNLGINLTGYSDYPFLPDYNNSAYMDVPNFNAQTNFTTGNAPVNVAIGDIDGDGKPDLVVANSSDNTVSVYHNTSSSGAITAGSFAAAVTFATGAGPQSVAIGDIDGDGKPDLVVANTTAGTISVYRNTSASGSITASSFAAAVVFAINSLSSSPVSIAIGDIDGDGKPDLVVGGQSGSAISVFRNTGSSGSITTGSFAAAIGVTTGSEPVSVAIGDIDGDGKPDLVVANEGSNTVSVLRNIGSRGAITAASFLAPVNFAAGTEPYSVAIGDIDGDGKPDLAVANYGGGGVSVFHNTGSAGSITTGSFAAAVGFTAGSDPISIAIGDMDGDGKPDLVVANQAGSTVSVLRNTGSSGAITLGSFAAQVTLATGTNPGCVAVGDIDGDGKPDIVVTNLSSNTISVIRNNPLPAPPPSPTITAVSPLVGYPASSVTLTGTGFNTTAADNIVYFGAIQATVSTASATSLVVTVPVGATYMRVSVDNLATNLTGYSDYPFLPDYNNIADIPGTVNFNPQTGFTGGAYPWSVAIGDIDGDGKPDLVVANYGNATVSVYHNTSSAGTITAGSFAAAVSFATGSTPYSVAIGDIDGDGKPDLAVANGESNTVSVLRNTGSAGAITTASFAAAVNFATGTTPWSVAIGDIDGDGKPDLVVANGGTNTVSVFRNTGSTGAITTGSFAAQVVFTTGDYPYSVAIGDINGDGKPDLALANSGDNTVSVLQNTGSAGAITSGSFAQQVTFAAGTEPISVAIGDIDGDGKPDLVAANQGSSNVSVFHNAGSSGLITTGSFAAAVTFAVGTIPFSVAMGDIDGDGKPDLAVANQSGNTVSVLRNTSSSGAITTGSFAAQVAFATGSVPAGVAIGDIDGDGKPDLVVTNLSSNTISVIRNNPLVAITGTTTLCAGGTVTLSDAASGGAWASGNTAIATIGSATGIITGIATGTVTISYAVIGGRATTVVTVNSLPSAPAAITGTHTVCPGATIALADATTGGVWSSNATATATAGSTTGVITGVATGTATISYTVSNTCGSTSATAVVTVNAAPATIGGTLSVCGTATTTLTETTTGGTWASGTTSVANIGSSSAIVTGVTAGTTVITYKVTATGCTAIATLTDNANPGVIGANTAVCAGSAITLTEAMTGGTWASGTTTIATAGSATGVISGVAAGTSTITYKLSTGCSVTAPVTVIAAPAAVGGTLSVCGTGTITLTETTTGGTWTSGTTTVANIGSSSAIVTGVTAGTTVITYKVTATGCKAIATLTDNASPAAIGANTAVCAGSAITLTEAMTGGTWASGTTTIATAGSATGVISGVAAGTSTITYKLSTGCSVTAPVTVIAAPAAVGGTLSVCGTGTITLTEITTGGTWTSGTTTVANIGSSSAIVTGVTAGTTVITYKVTATGCKAIATLTDNASPAAIGANTAVCVGSAITLTEAITGGTWASGSTAIAAAGSATGVISGVAPGTSAITYVLSTGCNVTTPVTVNAVPAAIVAGTLNACAAVATTLADATTGGYWTSAATTIATIGSSTGTVTGVATGTSVITYALTTGCATTQVYTVNASPVAIGANTGICTGSAITLTDAVTGGTWASGSTAIAAAGSATGVISGVAPGTSAITYILPTGCSVTVPVTVNILPAAIVAGTLNACAAVATTLTDATTGGYWTSGATTIATVGSSTGTVTGVATGTSVITYALTTGCAATQVYTVNASPVAIGANTGICTGSAITLTDAVTGGTWASGSTAIAAAGSATGVISGVAPGTSAITYILPTGCSVTVPVTVNILPAAIVAGTLNACAAVATTLTDATTGGYWTSGATTIATVGSSTGTVTGVATGTSVITYALTTGCAATQVYTVNVSPVAIGANTGICTGSAITLTDAVTGGTWASGSTAIATAGSATGVISGVAAGTSVITYVLSTGCSATAIVTINVVPAAITGTRDVCPLGTSGLGNATTGGYWTSSTTTIATVGSSTGIVTGVATGTSIITYTLPTGCATTKPYTVNPVPAAIGANTAVCAGTTITLTDATTGGTWISGTTTIATTGSATGVISGVAPGTSTITYKLPTECSITARVTVNASPAAITGTASVAVGATTSLADGATGGTWSSASTTIATVGSTGVVKGVATGSATISYTLSDGCAGTDEVTVAIAEGRAGNNAGNTGATSAMTDIRVIPNPNNGVFTIKGTLGTSEDEEISIQIVNMLGQVIYSNKVIAQNGDINQPVQLNGSVVNGMYILSLSSGNQNNTFHIVVAQ